LPEADYPTCFISHRIYLPDTISFSKIFPFVEKPLSTPGKIRFSVKLPPCRPIAWCGFYVSLFMFFYLIIHIAENIFRFLVLLLKQL